MRSPSNWSYPTRFTVVFGLAVIIAVLIAASTSTTAFGAYNTAWDGTADLRSLAEPSGTEIHFVQNTSAYGNTTADSTIAFILAPEQPYQSHETEQIEQFLQQGGTLVVADEQSTPTNSLLAGLGADARIDGTLLRDERVYYRSPAAPIVRNLSTHSTMKNVSALTLNHGSAVEPQNATVLARTSGYAYRDTNSNQDLDDSETVTDYPVVSTENIGAGRIIVVGDASLFINDMLERPGNKQFVRNLLASHDNLLLDYSHTTSLPPLIQGLLFLRNNPSLQFLCGGLGVLTIAFLQSRPAQIASIIHRLSSRTDRRPREQEDLDTVASNMDSSPVHDDDLVTHLRTQYPDWDAERLHRIVAARRQDETDTIQSSHQEDQK